MDRRKEKRYLYQTMVKYNGEEEYEEFDAISINVSSDGMKILSPIDQPIGATFQLKFKLADKDEPVEAKCEVVYKEQMMDRFMLGCRIKKLTGIKKGEMKKMLGKAFS